MRAPRLASTLALLLALTPLAGAQEIEDGWTDGARNPYARLPIRVALVNEAGDGERASIILDEIASAFRWWEQGGNGALAWQPAFTNASAVADADLVVLLVASDSVCGNTEAAGCGAPPANGSRGVVILPLYLADGRHVPPDRMVLVARHEVGHALGLRHSEDPTDVMYPTLHLANARADGLGTWLPFAATALFGAAVVIVAIARGRRAREPPAADAPPPCLTGPFHDFENGVCTQCGHKRSRGV